MTDDAVSSPEISLAGVSKRLQNVPPISLPSLVNWGTSTSLTVECAAKNCKRTLPNGWGWKMCERCRNTRQAGYDRRRAQQLQLEAEMRLEDAQQVSSCPILPSFFVFIYAPKSRVTFCHPLKSLLTRLSCLVNHIHHNYFSEAMAHVKQSSHSFRSAVSIDTTTPPRVVFSTSYPLPILYSFLTSRVIYSVRALFRIPYFSIAISGL